MKTSRTGGASRLTAILAGLASALLLAVVPPHWPAAQPAASGAVTQASSVDCAAETGLCEAAERWADFWDARERGEQPAIEAVGGTPLQRVVAAGDTVWMRYPNLWPREAERAQPAFQQVALAGEIWRMRALLAPLQADPQPTVAYRAHLELARVEWRAGQRAAAEEAVRRALELGEVAEPLRSDAFLLLGMVDLAAGRLNMAETALAQSIQRDAANWNAYWVLLDVLARRLAQGESDPTACLDRTRHLLETLALLPRLALDVTQFRDLADDLERGAARNSPAGRLAIGAAWLWAGDPARARKALNAVELAPAVLPSACDALLRGRARLLLGSRAGGGT